MIIVPTVKTIKEIIASSSQQDNVSSTTATCERAEGEGRIQGSESLTHYIHYKWEC